MSIIGSSCELRLCHWTRRSTDFISWETIKLLQDSLSHTDVCRIGIEETFQESGFTLIIGGSASSSGLERGSFSFSLNNLFNSCTCVVVLKSWSHPKQETSAGSVQI